MNHLSKIYRLYNIQIQWWSVPVFALATFYILGY